jgi:hypothetical protein
MALARVPGGMSLMELQWSGQSSTTSPLHYLRIRPTQLAAFVKADPMVHIIVAD